MASKPRPPKKVETLTHEDAKRRNIPTAELQPVMPDELKKPLVLEYERGGRNTDLDPQLVWRGLSAPFALGQTRKRKHPRSRDAGVSDVQVTLVAGA
jgi:hypothetical protein